MTPVNGWPPVVALTITGRRRFARVPSPSWPKKFLPSTAQSLAMRRAQVWSPAEPPPAVI